MTAPAAPERQTTLFQDVPRARALVMRYGWNATAYQTLNPGIGHWFTPDGEALVAYVLRRGVRVVAGAPICDPDRLAQVVQSFEDEAKSLGQRVCYFGAAGRVMDLLGDRPGYATIVLGAQPIWNPARWAGIIDGTASLRKQLNRARNKGVTVAEWSETRATNNPELRRCLREWLQSRSLPPMRFLVEPDTLTCCDDRRIFAATQNGVPIGFVTLSPIPCRYGWLIEQTVRGRDAPNGTAELMIDAAVRALAADSAAYVTMGLAPLSRNAVPPADSPPPRWLAWTLRWVRAHGRRFYNFDGLDRFKAKFQPDAWETIYAISNEPTFSFRTLYAIADAFSEGSAIEAVTRGLWKAVRQEARWLWERMRQ